MSLVQENQELRARVASLEEQVARLMPKPPMPQLEQNRISVQQSFYEIWSIVNGRRGSHPIIAPSLKRAQEEAAFVARGHLLDDFGHRAPSRPIYELADGESLDDVTTDGLFIARRTVDGDHQVRF
jgi:hypothetical protein